jgi:STAM-binding protein
VYAAEGNDPQTYLLLYRHANLVLEHLTNHPERNQPENRKALSAATAVVGSDIQTLEDIRPRIKKRHEEFQARRKAQQHALQSLEGKSVRLVAHELDGTSRVAHRRSYEKQTLDAEGNQSLATKLAQREVKRRDAARRSVRQAGVSEEEESERRTGGVWGNWEKELKHQSAEADGDLSAQLQEVARMQQNGHQAATYSVSESLPMETDLTFTAPSFPDLVLIPLPFSTKPRPATTTDGHIFATPSTRPTAKRSPPSAIRPLCFPTRTATETPRAAYPQITFRTAATTAPDTR